MPIERQRLRRLLLDLGFVAIESDHEMFNLRLGKALLHTKLSRGRQYRSIDEPLVADELRRWFGHDPAKWAEFSRRYRQELAAPELAASLADLKGRSGRGALTLVYAAADTSHNNAVVLRDVLTDQPNPEAP